MWYRRGPTASTTAPSSLALLAACVCLSATAATAFAITNTPTEFDEEKPWKVGGNGEEAVSTGGWSNVPTAEPSWSVLNEKYERIIVQGDIAQLRPRRRPLRPLPPSTTPADEEQLLRRRRMIINPSYEYYGYATWPLGIVPYYIDSSTYSAAGYTTAAQVVGAATSAWSSKTCVRFMAVGPQTQALVGHTRSVRIYNGGSCWSYVGCTAMDDVPQDMSLGESGCMQTGVAAHELGHALGLVHHQSRPDRDMYSVVLANHVRSGMALNFEKTPYPAVLVPTPYDVNSIMHYGVADFSRDGKATLLPKLTKLVRLLGNRQEQSFYDYKAMSILYNCSGSCNLPCQNDGYALQTPDGSCSCICPYGLGGALCDRVSLPCGGGVVSLNADGTPYNFASPYYPGKYPTGVVCGWLVKAPPGYVVKLAFTNFNVTAYPWGCGHWVDARFNLVAQPTPMPLCGATVPDPIYSRYDPSAESSLLLLLNATATNITTSTGFAAVASAYRDGCLGDPCRGAPCTSTPGSSTGFTCSPPSGGVVCGFEDLLSAACSSVHMDAAAYTKFAGGSPQRSWELFDTNSVLAPADGLQYMATKAAYHGALGVRGYFRIAPYAYGPAGRCLAFQYAVTSRYAGTLNVYRSVNGSLGQPLFSTSGGQDSGWNGLSLLVPATGSTFDLIEIVFEAVHDLDEVDDSSLIAIDSLRYTSGACPTGPCANYPCDPAAQCTATSSTTYNCKTTSTTANDASCGFESWEDCSTWLNYAVLGDNYDWRTYSWAGPGTQWPTATGAPGPAAGLVYLYGKLYDKPAGSKIWLRVFAFSGTRCLRFKYNMFGINEGSLSIYRSPVGGAYPGTLLWSVSGNQGVGWKSAAVSVNGGSLASSTPYELTIEVVRGNGYASDYGLDEFMYTNGACV